MAIQRNYFAPKARRCQASSPQLDQLLSLAQAAEILQISRRSLYRYVEEKMITHLRVGGFIRFRPRDLDAWLDDQRVCAERG